MQGRFRLITAALALLVTGLAVADGLEVGVVAMNQANEAQFLAGNESAAQEVVVPVL